MENIQHKRKLDENCNVEDDDSSQKKVLSQELPSTYQTNESNEDEGEQQESFRATLYPIMPTLKKIELTSFSDQKVTIGRAAFHREKVQPFPQSHLLYISEKHCVVEKNPFIPQDFIIQDCSRNGVFLNGKRMQRGSRSTLENCTEIALGKEENKTYCFINQKNVLKDDVVSSLYVRGPHLGSGALGIVYRCFRSSDGYPLAMKIIKKLDLSHVNPNESARQGPNLIDREIKILQKLSKLDHPNIVKLLDVFDRPNEVMLVMELCCEDMLAYLRARMWSYTESEAKVCMKQVLVALNFLHSNKIVHRDLKLENILVFSTTPEFCVKLADFGLSRTADLSQPKTICGTEYYLAPEIIRASQRKESYTEKVDCWSAGVVMYLLLVKAYPFIDSEREGKTLFDKILTQKVTFSHSSHKVSIEAQSLVANLLRKNYEKRFDANRALQHQWFDESSSSASDESLTSATEDSVSATTRN